MKDETSHSYQVVVWQPAIGGSFLFNKGCWVEYARCITESRAKEVAICLSLRHRGAIAVAKLNEQATKFVNYIWFPDEATVKQRTKSMDTPAKEESETKQWH
ncbi:MAG TPA: hypothetical protein VNG51_00425 [Ktedonobacteraceae bacterium]|nr:hypothetical protein [Ktedonobacteraceae bacterium]